MSACRRTEAIFAEVTVRHGVGRLGDMAGNPSTFPRPALPVDEPGRMHEVFEAGCDADPERIAVECRDDRISYGELDARANQLAHHLRALGIADGARVAILLPRSVATYVSLLAVGKTGAAFVPIDPVVPPDRIAFIAGDAGTKLLITCSQLAGRTSEVGCPVLNLDSCIDAVRAAPSTRPNLSLPDETDPIAYVMYTSGSSGRPKGVEIAQSSIINFLRVVPRVYDVRRDDRVLQGMTISFDFSIEEIWPTWAVGATLVAGPDDARRLGGELADFLTERQITVLYCVPTLLATLPRDVPGLRSVLVGGEACPAPLVERWSRPGRRMLNTYGPTEATVTATWSELRPGRPVTIGRPLPTYSVVLLDEQRGAVKDGAVGEICIGGPGVARGYVGRPDLTADRFIAHPLAPAGCRLYRTGDLGRWTPDGEIEYLGRADAEVKIRGHRVDLGEIDNVLLEDADVAEAVAALVPVPGSAESTELAAYLVPVPGSRVEPAVLLDRLSDRLRRRLPAYMVPAYLDVVPALPTMPSGKVDRKRLPAPSGRRLLGSGPVVAARGEPEAAVRAVWADVLGVDAAGLSVTADFFCDLGGHSLLAAQVVSALRASGVGAVAVRDLYAHPTVRGLAAHLAATPLPAAVQSHRPEVLRHRRGRIAAAGSGQAAALYLLLLLVTLPVSFVYTRNDGDVSVQVLAELMVAVLVSYLGIRWIVPVLLVRPLSAGIRPGRHPLWGTVYLRLWVVDLLLAVGPLPVLSGSPFIAGYLRLLGARIGRRCTIVTSTIGLPALLRLGSNAAIGYGVSMRPWTVQDGWVEVGRIDVGTGAFVGANAVLEPGVRIGAGSGLGEQSVLGPGGSVPAGERWAGSPARRVPALGPDVESMLCARAARRGWRVHHLAAAVAGLVLLELTAIGMVIPAVALVWWALLGWGVLAGLLATLLTGPVFVLTVCVVVASGKRLIGQRSAAGIQPVRSTAGVRKWMVDTLLAFSLQFTNSLYATLYTVGWLRLLGARVGRGAEVSTAAHLDPDLLVLGESSFVADMATVGAATFAGGYFAVGPTEVGARAFVGNAAVVPTGSRLGAGSLVGVGSVPAAADVPEGTSWLGSPPIHLPVRQSSGTFAEDLTFRPARRAVRRRMVIEFFRATLPATLLGISFYLYLLALSGLAGGRNLPVPAFVSPLVAALSGLGVIAFCAAVKRNVVGAYRPRVEPLWSEFVRRTEFVTGLFEAAAVPAGVGILVGTPFLPPVLRWFGARIGRRVWIGTTYLTEFDLVEIGDDATVGMEASLQTHLFEDRVMKMSALRVGAGAGVGTRAIVLYDAVVDDGATLGALSLALKGEHLAAGTSWRGIPAETATPLPAPPAPELPAARLPLSGPCTAPIPPTALPTTPIPRVPALTPLTGGAP